eukprot:762054-Prorocentrum_minimum.AAC.1
MAIGATSKDRASCWLQPKKAFGVVASIPLVSHNRIELPCLTELVSYRKACSSSRFATENPNTLASSTQASSRQTTTGTTTTRSYSTSPQINPTSSKFLPSLVSPPPLVELLCIPLIIFPVHMTVAVQTGGSGAAIFDC